MTDFKVWCNMGTQANIYKRINDGTALNTKDEAEKLFIAVPVNIVKNALSSLGSYTGDKLKVENDALKADGDRDYIPHFKALLHLWHAYEMGPVPSNSSATGTGDNYFFKIKSNGDVQVIEIDPATKQPKIDPATDKPIVLATAYDKNAPENSSSNCEKNATTKDVCVRQMAFLSEMGGNEGMVDLSLNYDNLDLNIYGDDMRDKQTHHKIANAYAILRRIGWRAHVNEDKVYTLEEYAKAGLENRQWTDKEYALLAVAVFGENGDGAHIDGKDINTKRNVLMNKNQTDIETWYGNTIKPSANRTPFGKLVKECVEVINQNSSILSAQAEPQTVGNPTSMRRRASRMAGFNDSNRLAGVIAFRGPYMRGGAHIVNTRSNGQVGGGDDHAVSTIYTNQFNQLLASLSRKGKTLSSDTKQKFEKKINEIAVAEKQLNDFTKSLQQYNNNNAPDTNTHLTEANIKEYNQASKTIHNKTTVLESAFANIKLKMNMTTAPEEASFRTI